MSVHGYGCGGDAVCDGCYVDDDGCRQARWGANQVRKPGGFVTTAIVEIGLVTEYVDALEAYRTRHGWLCETPDAIRERYHAAERALFAVVGRAPTRSYPHR